MLNKKVQIEINKEWIPVSAISSGQTFQRNNKDIFMRLRPTGYILNSSTISESLAVGKALVVDLQTGAAFFLQGTELVRPVVHSIKGVKSIRK